MNDGINRDLCSLSYMSTDDIGSVVLQFGQGARIEKHPLTDMLASGGSGRPSQDGRAI